MFKRKKVEGVQPVIKFAKLKQVMLLETGIDIGPLPINDGLALVAHTISTLRQKLDKFEEAMK